MQSTQCYLKWKQTRFCSLMLLNCPLCNLDKFFIFGRICGCVNQDINKWRSSLISGAWNWQFCIQRRKLTAKLLPQRARELSQHSGKGPRALQFIPNKAAVWDHSRLILYSNASVTDGDWSHQRNNNKNALPLF